MRVIDEGRAALRDLRFSNPEMHDLEQAFARIGKEVAAEQHVHFKVIVEGRRRPLRPLIRDEVYRIGREAIVNAFRHAQAKQIEVEIGYTPKVLHVIVRDDGCGINPAVASLGHDGHFGLSGMRERAKRVKGHISVRSRLTAGTEVALTVPGRVAFQLKPRGIPCMLRTL
jgi:signal transduction histidine kinase